MDSPMIAVVGAGAVGTLLAAALAANRRRFYWVERSDSRRGQLAGQEVQIGEVPLEIDSGNYKLLAAISELPSDLDIIIIAVKSFSVHEAVAAIGPRARHTLVVANGLMDCGFNLGLLYGGGNVNNEGMTSLMSDNRLFAGPLPGSDPIDASLADMLGTPWLEVSIEADIRIRMFHKLALNCVINPLTAILDKPNSGITGPECLPLMEALLSEICLVAKSKIGNIWQYDSNILLNDCLELIARTADNSSSMREDLRRGQRTEISSLNLAVAELAAGSGLDCPCNRYMGNMICLLTNRHAL